MVGRCHSSLPGIVGWTRATQAGLAPGRLAWNYLDGEVLDGHLLDG